MKIIVEEARVEDKDKIISIFKESFKDPDKYWVLRDLRYTYVLIARLGEEVIGAEELYYTSVEGLGGLGVIYYIAVKKEWRRLGIGSLLVRKAENIFKEWGCAYSAASTRSSNTASIALFTKLGYKMYTVGDEMYRKLVAPLYAWEDDIIFIRSLGRNIEAPGFRPQS